MEYKCVICNKTYSSYQSHWIHNKKYHANELTITDKKYECNSCNKIFNSRQSKYQHQQKCCNNTITDEIKQLKAQIKELEKLNQPKLISNCNNNNSNNTTKTTNNGIINNITINQLGDESISKLTKNDIKTLAKLNLNAFAMIIELLNFNKNIPENHNFCTTSLEGNYVNYYNKKNNRIEKMNKNDYIDKVLVNSIKKIEDLTLRLEFNMDENNLSPKYLEKFMKTVEKKEEILNYRKSYHKNINEISYNNKEMVLDTWKSGLTLNENVDTDSDISSLNSEEKEKCKFAVDLDNLDSDSV